MRDALSKGVLAEPYPYLTAGTKVEIHRGPLQGMSGILIRRQNKYRVVISVDLIMRAMAVEVDAADVSPLRKNFSHSAISSNARLSSISMQAAVQPAAE